MSMIHFCWLCMLGWVGPTPLIQTQNFPWPNSGTASQVHDRFPPPAGFKPIPLPQNSFGTWLRQLPLFTNHTEVRLYDGRKKANQSAHLAVFDIDVGRRDLQQCADAVMRLRAEYLRAVNREDAIAFNFTSGDLASWQQWRQGMRPQVSGNKVFWQQKAAADNSYRNFRRYLDSVFTYAGSASLILELKAVKQPEKILPGDVFIQGGFPGHAVIVMDVVENEHGQRRFMLAQSYMPAQQIHLLRSPANRASPWYPAKNHGLLKTPEWPFKYADLHRFQL